MSGTDALLALLQVFEREEIPYMVVGSYSSNFYGMPRMTKDADVVVHLASPDWTRIPDMLPDGISMQDQASFEMVTATLGEGGLDWNHIREWCDRHETLELLEKARSQAAVVWELDD